jgi:hypothetical protein
VSHTPSLSARFCAACLKIIPYLIPVQAINPYIMLQRSVPQITTLQRSITGHSVPHAANAVQAFSLPSDVATPMADDSSQWLAMAIAHSECQSRFDSLILNHGVTFLPPAGQFNSPRMCRFYYRTRRNLRVRRKTSGAKLRQRGMS